MPFEIVRPVKEIATCAAYVDGDGVPFWRIERALDDLRARCVDVHVRAYKDWTNVGHQRLMAPLWDLGVDLVQVTPHAGFKNGTDIAIAVDVVDTLHRSPTTAVALVGNDGDFTPLADHLRRKGVEVIGYGSRDASDSLSEACDHFVRFDPMTRAPIDPTISLRPVSELVNEIIVDSADRDGWMPLNRFGHSMLIRYGVRAKDTGAASWSRYLSSNSRFECSIGLDGVTRVRLREESRTIRGDSRAS